MADREGRGSKFRTLQPSDFSLLHPSCYSCQSRQGRFVICPQCPISIELLSRKVDSATDCVYSYRFERAPSRSNSVEERARISTAHIILSRGLTSVPVDEMSEESVAYSLGTAVAVVLHFWLRFGDRDAESLPSRRLDGQHHDDADRHAERDRSQYEDRLDGISLRVVSRQSIAYEHEGQLSFVKGQRHWGETMLLPFIDR